MWDDIRQTFVDIDDTMSSAKRGFGKALVDATNLQPADMRQLPAMRDSQNTLREQAADAADLILPGTSDALPLGKIAKLGKLEGTAAKIIGKLKSMNDKFPANTVQVIEDLPAMTRKGYDLLDKPVFNVGKQAFGEVTHVAEAAAKPDLGKVIQKALEEPTSLGKIVDKSTPAKPGYGKIVFRP